jgi:ribose-phosphate pyrophosphokinase
MPSEKEFMLFAGTSHRELAERIAQSVGISLGKVSIETFPDGEIGVQILENVRGRDVFVLQSIARHPNSYLMELLILVDALKRASANSISAVIPYFGYARQDRKDKGRDPITAKLVANMLEKAGVTRVLTMDLHAPQIEGFFDIPVDNLYARPLLVEELKKLGIKDFIVASPDVGSSKLARDFAAGMHTEFAIVDKRRLNAKHVETTAIIGDMKEKNVLLVDDMCTTGETLRIAAAACKQAGAKRVLAAVTHGLFLTSAVEESAIEMILTGDTVPLSDEHKRSDKIKVVSVASLFGKAIHAIVGADSISRIYGSLGE